MKHQKQSIINQSLSTSSLRFLIEPVGFIYNGFTVEIQAEVNKFELTRRIQIKLERENSSSSQTDSDNTLMLSVKLLSAKGLAFTAGIISISFHEYHLISPIFSLKFTKSQDFQVYCDCRRLYCGLSLQANKKSQEQVINSDCKTIQCKQKSKSINSSLQKKSQKIINVQTKKAQIYEKSKIKIQKNNLNKMNSNISKVNDRQIKNQIEPLRKIDELEAQLYKNQVLFEKQKEIILILEQKQQQYLKEKSAFKNQIKIIQKENDEKRDKIRELESEKLRLLLNNLQFEKQVTEMKQKIIILIEKFYEKIKNIFFQKDSKINQMTSKSFSNKKSKDLKLSILKNEKCTIEFRQSGQQSKVAFSAVRGLINKQYDQNEFEQSLGRDNNPSSVLSNTLYDMSISGINGRNKQISLLNSDMFFKPIETEHTQLQTQNSRLFIEQLNKKLKKAQDMILKRIQITIESLIENFQKNNNLKDAQSGDQSLLNYLQQLENGFQRQLQALNEKKIQAAYDEELIKELENKLSEKQNLVVQLQEKLYNLQQEKQKIKNELHEANYSYSLRQQQFIKKIHMLENGKSFSKIYSSPSPKNLVGHRREYRSNNILHEQEIIELKQQLKLMQIYLLHETEQKQKNLKMLQMKEEELHLAILQKQKLQISLKLRDRIVGLNQSIQISIQEELENKTDQKKTQQSLKTNESPTPKKLFINSIF